MMGTYINFQLRIKNGGRLVSSLKIEIGFNFHWEINEKSAKDCISSLNDNSIAFNGHQCLVETMAFLAHLGHSS